MYYQVIIEKTNTGLSQSITTLISEGWQLQGGVSVTIVSNTVGRIGFKDEFLYAQAMTKSRTDSPDSTNH
jgi:hypothetical protein